VENCNDKKRCLGGRGR